ncbi:MAG TPA: guanylate kinase [Verrucomicrobiales bacterium]|nr:guanylate kinase [Verrucomicrobiales bacterium]
MATRFRRTGILCVVSGPSGVGKTTLCRNLAQKPGYVYSVSCTTREARAGEINGADYYFLGKEEFRDRVRRKQFLEHAEVHGHDYGTLKSSVLGLIQEGQDVLLDLDVQGAAQIRKNRDPLIRAAYVDVFVIPASLVELHRRLSRRGDSNRVELDLRMDNARQEMGHWKEYQYCMLSGTPMEDRQTFEMILEAERRRASRLSLPGERRR